MADFCSSAIHTERSYGVDFSCTASNFRCVLFDMQDIWTEELLIADMLLRQKRRNPTVDYNEALVGITLLAGGAANFDLSTADDGLTLEAKYYVETFPISFQFHLRPGDASQTSRHIIMPLWRTVLLLDAKTRALKKELARKDVEIAQYREEGACLKRTTVQTEEFNEQKFDNDFPIQLGPQIVNVQRILSSNEQRNCLLQALQMNATVSSSGSGSATNSPTVKNKSPRSRRAKKRRSGLFELAPSARQAIQYEEDADETGD